MDERLEQKREHDQQIASQASKSSSPDDKKSDTPKQTSPEAAYRQERVTHWNQVAQETEKGAHWARYYHHRLTQVYQFLAAPAQKVLEIGCGQGGLLATLQPSKGLGVDLSVEMIQRARKRHPNLDFIAMDAHNLNSIQKTYADIAQNSTEKLQVAVTESPTHGQETGSSELSILPKTNLGIYKPDFEQPPYDVIILSDLVNDLWDVQKVLDQIKPLSHSRTRVILNFYSRLWELPLAIAEKLGLAKPTLFQNWLTPEDTTNLLHLSGFEVIRSWPEILWPLRTPLIDSFFNKILVKLWPFKELAITNFIVARPQPVHTHSKKAPSVSVVIAARNEAGNIPAIFERVPKMGSQTELVFVEGHSTDNTYEAIQDAIKANPGRSCQLHKQRGKGKGDAIRLGFQQAQGDILMILDADLTVPPEDLPRFYAALVTNRGEFINGVRLVYPMEEQAMRFFNILGNKFFSLTFSWLLDQPIKDTLCGTKVLWKKDYELIAANRDYFGDFDPFGDFDLLFGAAKMGLKIVDLPIRYHQRVYGETNIERWKHGWLLLKMVVNAARLLKFV
ncbi:MAG: bifunctional class I SAM-dependent methyltransferase/glycosyltransferase family 2 protein [Chloroflexota bacterium]|nr:bifunctional class I SAM-dependent methyltransferase/glycosyltransferase family 2 protein [Chloroflexota bacterium]